MPQQSETCVKFSVFRTIFGVKFGDIFLGHPSPGKCSTENFTKISRQISRHLWQRKTETIFTSALLQGSCSDMNYQRIIYVIVSSGGVSMWATALLCEQGKKQKCTTFGWNSTEWDACLQNEIGNYQPKQSKAWSASGTRLEWERNAIQICIIWGL